MEKYNELSSLERILKGEVKGGICVCHSIPVLQNDKDIYYYKYSDLETNQINIVSLLNDRMKGTGNEIINNIAFSNSNGYLKAEFMFYPLYAA